MNDGSPDNCREIIESYAREDDRIVVINKENGGLSSARNAGLRAARGEYITFADSDDWVEAETYDRLHTLAVSFFPKFDAVFCGYSLDRLGRCSCRPLAKDDTLDKDCVFLFAKKRIRTVWQGIYRRDFLNTFKITFEESIRGAHEDELFNFDFFARNPYVAATTGCYYHYVQHEASEMHRFQENRMATANVFSAQAKEHLEQIPDCPEAIKKELIRRISSSYFGVLLNEYGSGSPYSAKERRERLQALTQCQDFVSAIKEAQSAGQLDLKRTFAWSMIKMRQYFLLDCICQAAAHRIA